jgi:hypothetical protein
MLISGEAIAGKKSFLHQRRISEASKTMLSPRDVVDSARKESKTMLW